MFKLLSQFSKKKEKNNRLRVTLKNTFIGSCLVMRTESRFSKFIKVEVLAVFDI